MVNTEALRRKIDESGYKMTFIAEKCGITYQGLLNKINNVREFKVSESGALKDLLKLDDSTFNAIFFNYDVDGQSTTE